MFLAWYQKIISEFQVSYLTDITVSTNTTDIYRNDETTYIRTRHL